MMKRWTLWVSFGGAVWGAVFSIISTIQHFRIAEHGFEQPSFCAINEAFNCDIVTASSYSEMFGVPIAWWGLCYYGVLGIFALVAALSSKERKATVSIAWFISIGGIFYSIYLAVVAFFILKVICLICMAMYLANIVLFVFLFFSIGIRPGRIFEFIWDYLSAVFGRHSNLGFKPKVIGHVVAVAAVFLLGWLAILSVDAGMGETKVGVDEKLRAFYMQSVHDIDVNPAWPMWGNPDARVTIVEFSEYQCPFCRIAAFGVKPYLYEFKDDIRYFFVNYPLDNSCNDQLQRPMHPLACYAARAGYCSKKFGKFWEFHDELFREQSSLSDKRILDIAESMGINRDEFKKCIDSPAAAIRVREELAAGQKIYVKGTPSIFLDGRKLKYWRDPDFLRAVVEEEIEKKEK